MTAELSRKLGYAFREPRWLTLALTHRSYGEENNERLEFFGDSLVNLVISEALFQQFPHAQEGDLSRWRATLINRETLGTLGRQFDLGRYLRLGMGELKSGGSERTSIISCAMEAVIGAIYFDSDFATVRECILRWYAPLLTRNSALGQKDPKTRLQEYLQQQHSPLPVYEVLSVIGETHNQQTFTVSCTVQDKQTIGEGTSRRRAEQAAAEKMLEVIK